MASTMTKLAKRCLFYLLIQYLWWSIHVSKKCKHTHTPLHTPLHNYGNKLNINY